MYMLIYDMFLYIIETPKKDVSPPNAVLGVLLMFNAGFTLIFLPPENNFITMTIEPKSAGEL